MRDIREKAIEAAAAQLYGYVTDILAMDAARDAIDAYELAMGGFARGDNVCKIKGASWRGHVVGYYSTKLTPQCVAVESMHERGSVQIYPASALKRVEPWRWISSL